LFVSNMFIILKYVFCLPLRKHHHVVVDNGFTSPLLCRDMFDNQAYLTGTVRATRKNMPKSFRNMKLQKGERVVRQSGAIMALKYVFFISSYVILVCKYICNICFKKYSIYLHVVQLRSWVVTQFMFLLKR
jgi:hypothetical protein